MLHNLSIKCSNSCLYKITIDNYNPLIQSTEPHHAEIESFITIDLRTNKFARINTGPKYQWLLKNIGNFVYNFINKKKAGLDVSA